AASRTHPWARPTCGTRSPRGKGGAPRAASERGRVVVQRTTGPPRRRAASRRRREVEHAGAAESVRFVVARPEGTTPARLGAPLLDLHGDDIRGIEVYGWGRVVVPACRTPWEVARDHGLERDGGCVAIERRCGVGEAHHAAVVQRVIQRGAGEY